MAQVLLPCFPTMEAFLVHIALASYAAGAAAFLSWLVRPAPRRANAGRALLLAGAVVHAASIPLMRTPFATSWQGSDVLSLVALAIAAGYLFADPYGRTPVAGVFAAPLAVAVSIPAHLVSGERSVAPALWNSAALYVHVGAAIAGTAAMALAVALAALYLVSERQAKVKNLGRIFARVPSLDSIDRGGYRFAVWGFVFLSCAIATGSIASLAVSESIFPLHAKEVFAVFSWVLLAALIEARMVAGWRGKRTALLVLIGFAMLAGTYVGLASSASPRIALASASEGLIP